MADGLQDIESIVREVLRRLHSRDDNVAAEHKPETEREIRSGEKESGRLAIHDRVVTLATIQDRLDSVRQLVLQRGAVVTPAVRDELRRRRVAITYGCSSSPESSQCALLVAVAATACGRAPLLRAVESAAGRFRHIEAESLPVAIQQLIPPVASGQTLGLLFTGQRAAALCLANRNAGVRAAQAASPACVAEAVNTIGANLLVVDPARRSLHEVKEIVREFTRPGRRECSPEFRELLDAGQHAAMSEFRANPPQWKTTS